MQYFNPTDDANFKPTNFSGYGILCDNAAILQWPVSSGVHG